MNDQASRGNSPPEDDREKPPKGSHEKLFTTSINRDRLKRKHPRKTPKSKKKGNGEVDLSTENVDNPVKKKAKLLFGIKRC